MSQKQWTGVLACRVLDLRDLYGAVFADVAPQITLLTPEEVTNPESVDFVLSWAPPKDAFTPYPNLRGIFSIAAGMDAIMACPSRPKDVPVFRVEDPDQAAQMAGFAAFHIIWHHRKMRQYLEDQTHEIWNRPNSGRSPAKVRVGVMGFGFMGRAVARGAAALGYSVATLSRSMPAEPEAGMVHFVDADRSDFLARTDILVNVLPMTPATKGLFDADLFSALPNGAAFIHLGRGRQLDDAALLAALDSGQLSGASLDVFAPEPLLPGHPFWSHPKIFVTPHTASEAEPTAVAANVVKHLSAMG
ncbi:NAD(P)-dependent oxidoreductase [Puniceibacterium sediminis]|uniref:Glyoxylate/hydroxypyruvate reductase A n=1 Tax=Puniceibacterium sediminis TaxID=1608407 RepID=A0A238XCT8_9RHOB|nr:NAD(P)-dependent oxidoreductase [Puniceibacterium sediminis]SNR56807.1 glyoxylate/hydroxypyruvate reductase A [Puniceibacterium sediminis]